MNKTLAIALVIFCVAPLFILTANKKTDLTTLKGAWLFLGDSETSGRAEGQTTKSQALAFSTIWGKSTKLKPAVKIDGIGGCSLKDSFERYQKARNKNDLVLINLQESGNQDKDGQRTVEEYIKTLTTTIETIAKESPKAIITFETAYSFNRESQKNRNWEPYNLALKEKIKDLTKKGLAIYLVDVDANIKALVKQVGKEKVLTKDGGHYTSLGNLLVALSIYQSLGISPSTLDLSDIPDAEISAELKSICVKITENQKN